MDREERQAFRGAVWFVESIRSWLQEASEAYVDVVDFNFDPQGDIQLVPVGCERVVDCSKLVEYEASVGGVKGLAQFLVALLSNPSSELAAKDFARVLRLGWGPVDLQLQSLEGLDPALRAAIEAGGGSGAGFQVSCGADEILSAGGGGGGGIQAWDSPGDQGSNSSERPEDGRVSSGGGGGGGGGGLQVFASLPGLPPCTISTGGGGGCGRHLGAMLHFCGSSGDAEDGSTGRGAKNVGCDGRRLNETLAACARGPGLRAVGGGGGGGGVSICCKGPAHFSYGFNFTLAASPAKDARLASPGASMARVSLGTMPWQRHMAGWTPSSAHDAVRPLRGHTSGIDWSTRALLAMAAIGLALVAVVFSLSSRRGIGRSPQRDESRWYWRRRHWTRRRQGDEGSTLEMGLGRRGGTIHARTPLLGAPLGPWSWRWHQ